MAPLLEHDAQTIVLTPSDGLANNLLLSLMQKLDSVSQQQTAIDGRMANLEKSLQASATNTQAPRMIGRWTSTEFVLLACCVTITVSTACGVIVVLLLTGHEGAALGIIERALGLKG